MRLSSAYCIRGVFVGARLIFCQLDIKVFCTPKQSCNLAHVQRLGYTVLLLFLPSYLLYPPHYNYHVRHGKMRSENWLGKLESKEVIDAENVNYNQRRSS